VKNVRSSRSRCKSAHGVIGHSQVTPDSPERESFGAQSRYLYRVLSVEFDGGSEPLAGCPDTCKTGTSAVRALDLLRQCRHDADNRILERTTRVEELLCVATECNSVVFKAIQVGEVL